MNTENTNLIQEAPMNMELKTKKRSKFLTKKTLLSCAMILFAVAPIFAQVTQLEGKIDGWKSDVGDVLDAAVAIFAIAGGFLIFIQYMQGNQEAQKNLIRFVIGLGIFGLIDFIVGIFIP